MHDAPLPIIVYFHGGGWVTCSIDFYDGLCRALANGANCIVVSVGYLLAPEYKFPAAIKDAYAATAWIASHAAQMGKVNYASRSCKLLGHLGESG